MSWPDGVVPEIKVRRFLRMTVTGQDETGYVLGEDDACDEIAAILNDHKHEAGASYTFEVIEVTEAEYDAMEEFEGF